MNYGLLCGELEDSAAQVLNMLLVMYAKVADDKKVGPSLAGIYFGGVRANEEDADDLATRCVSETQGGLVIPQVVPIKTTFRDTVEFAEAQLIRIVDQMRDNYDTLYRD